MGLGVTHSSVVEADEADNVMAEYISVLLGKLMCNWVAHNADS